jgi:hypothetical protein
MKDYFAKKAIIRLVLKDLVRWQLKLLGMLVLKALVRLVIKGWYLNILP